MPNVILVILSLVNGGYAPATAPFSSVAACEAAAAEIQKGFKTGGNVGVRGSAMTLCLKTG